MLGRIIHRHPRRSEPGPRRLRRPQPRHRCFLVPCHRGLRPLGTHLFRICRFQSARRMHRPNDMSAPSPRRQHVVTRSGAAMPRSYGPAAGTAVGPALPEAADSALRHVVATCFLSPAGIRGRPSRESSARFSGHVRPLADEPPASGSRRPGGTSRRATDRLLYPGPTRSPWRALPRAP